MTTAFTWHELKKLVVIDHHRNELLKSIKKNEAAVLASANVHTKLVEQLHACQHSLRTIQKEIDRLELSSKDVRAQLIKKKNQLAGAMSEKETIALEHEQTTLRNTLGEIDTQSMTLLEQQEALQTTLTSLEARVADSEKTHHALVAATEVTIAHAKNDIAGVDATWHEQLVLVPLELRTNYLNLRSRIPNPVVPVMGTSCSGCHMELLTQDVHSLSTRTVIQCRGCYRFLFVPDATTPPATHQAA